ncbi:MAG: Sua5 family C-terminal domain-containing protein, partial [Thermodesulfobacteriota bacterium]
GGTCSVGIESTIIALTDGDPVILRPGAISPEALERAIGESVGPPGIHRTVRAPGMLASHYAPETPLRLVHADRLPALAAALSAEGKRVAVMALSGCRSETGKTVAMPSYPAAYGHDLYAVIRTLDDGQHDVILAERPPRTAPWLAVNDRLQRACGGNAD